MPPPSIEPAGFFTGVQLRPVIVGVVVDYISTYVAMAIFIFGYLAKELARNGEVTSELIAEYMASPEGLRAALIIGSLCTALGGFVAARRAKTLEIKHGAFVGLGSLIISFIERLMQGQPTPLPEWFQFVSIVVVIPAGALGGFVAGLLHGSSNRGLPQRPFP
jgi:putative membrane protein (TIGR04086 family)